MPRSLRSFLFESKSPTGDTTPTFRPSSPTLSATTNASEMDLSESVDTIITRADLRASIQAYDNLISCCTAYRDALLAMSHASSNLADAMDTCSRLKGVSEHAGMNLQAAGGLHYLMANHWDVLGHTLEQNIEDPLYHHVEHYRAAVNERSAAYERKLREKSKFIKQTEADNIKFGRQKKRDLHSFRQALSVLQAQVDELDRLKVAHYSQVLDDEEQVWDIVSGKVCLVVRSTLDMYDRVTSKASDPVLEAMVQSIPDPFDSYGPPKTEDHIYSILPPLAMTPGGDSAMEGVRVWTNNTGLSFPRSEPTSPDTEDTLFTGRIRRHSTPLLSTPSSSSLPPSPLATAPTMSSANSKRRSQPQLPTILSVINETRGRAEAQETLDNEHADQETRNGVAEDHDPNSIHDITPTSTLRKSQVPLIRPDRPPQESNGMGDLGGEPDI